jgi:uncharacterized membrane protein YuzA (DUF378 family)
MRFTLRIIHWFALALVVIGALNWGMIGFFQINVVSLLLGPVGSRILFAIVGIAGVWCISLFKHLASCDIQKGYKK